jgi:hypothetical protein
MFPVAGGWDSTGLEDDYRMVNRASWDERVPAHAASPDYQLERYAADPGFLSAIVRFDRPRLGTVSGLCGVHSQCHIGTDTVSLARLGASMTGLDFSGPAVVRRGAWPRGSVPMPGSCRLMFIRPRCSGVLGLT